jgi:hypothetical protein
MLESMGNTESQTYYPFDYAWTYDKLGMMPHAYNLSYSGGKCGIIIVSNHNTEKKSKSIITTTTKKKTADEDKETMRK